MWAIFKLQEKLNSRILSMPTTLGTKFNILFEVWTFDSLLNLTFENWFCLIFSDFLHLVKWFFWSCWFFDVWKKDLWFWWLLILTAVAFFQTFFFDKICTQKRTLILRYQLSGRSFRSKIGYSPLSTRHIKLVLRGIYFLWTDWKPDKRLKFVNDTSGERILQEGTFICVLVEQNGA